jgi:hypothetical protein
MLDRLPFYLKHTLVYKSIVDEYNNMEKIRENESNFGWDLVQLYRNLYLNIIINVFQAQYDQSLQKWKMWGEYDGVNTELAWIFKDKL